MIWTSIGSCLHFSTFPLGMHTVPHCKGLCEGYKHAPLTGRNRFSWSCAKTAAGSKGEGSPRGGSQDVTRAAGGVWLSAVCPGGWLSVAAWLATHLGLTLPPLSLSCLSPSTREFLPSPASAGVPCCPRFHLGKVSREVPSGELSGKAPLVPTAPVCQHRLWFPDLSLALHPPAAITRGTGMQSSTFAAWGQPCGLWGPHLGSASWALGFRGPCLGSASWALGLRGSPPGVSLWALGLGIPIWLVTRRGGGGFSISKAQFLGGEAALKNTSYNLALSPRGKL